MKIQNNEDIAIKLDLESLPMTIVALKCDPDLNLLDDEPKLWSQSVPEEVVRSFKDKNAVKRQEQIFEFILNEKRNYLVLMSMQNIFCKGLERYFQFDQAILDSLFPHLAELISLHAEFLKKLRRRQSENYFVESIADILLNDFFEFHCNRLKTIYGEFCVNHNEAVHVYKSYSKSNSEFKKFENFCKNSPLLKKRGIYECILHVSLILTKYPLLIQSMIKTCQDPNEHSLLNKSLKLSREILIHVDSTMAKKQREDRKLEIYEKIEDKSFATYNGRKFKRSEFLNANRLLVFEGTATIQQSNRTKRVIVLVLTDVLVFLQETSSQMFAFFKPDNCSAVISLQKILVRKKASLKNKDPNTIYLVVSNTNEPTIIELHVERPKELKDWDNSIRSAVINCPIDDNFSPVSGKDNEFILKQNEIRNLVKLLRQKDVEQAIVMEEKMSVQHRLLATSGVEPPVLTPYQHLVREANVDSASLNELVLSTMQEMSQLSSTMYSCGPNLSRSVSSAGEPKSNTYTNPALPKRSDTFGGFERDSSPFLSASTSSSSLSSSSSNTFKAITQKLQTDFVHFADNVSENSDKSFKTMNVNRNSDVCIEDGVKKNLDESSASIAEQKVIVQILHYAYTLLCMVAQLTTTNDSLKAELELMKSTRSNDSKIHYKHNQQLEELRSLQDKFTADKIAWQKQCEQKEYDLAIRELEFAREKEQSLEKIKRREEDLEQQREQLFRQLKMLKNRGVLLSPPPPSQTFMPNNNVSPNCGNVIGLGTTLGDDKRNRANANDTSYFGTGNNVTSSNNTNASKKQLPINLLSVTNQQKALAKNLPVKQQLPYKLAKNGL